MSSNKVLMFVKWFCQAGYQKACLKIFTKKDTLFYAKSNRSLFMTFDQAVMKSLANASFPSSDA